jgi:hypothetical protein
MHDILGCCMRNMRKRKEVKRQVLERAVDAIQEVRFERQR